VQGAALAPLQKNTGFALSPFCNYLKKIMIQ